MTDLHAKGINATVRFDGSHVHIKRGMLMQGRSEKSYPVSALGALQYRSATSLVNGYLQLSPAGEVAKKGKGVGLANDENTVIFRKSAGADFDTLVAAIRSAQSAPTAAAPDITDQLAKLAQLKDAGVLTDDEFDAKKAELLNRM